jgi:hypothetical protein
VAKAFLRDNPKVFAQESPDVEIIEKELNPNFLGLTAIIQFGVRVAGVPVDQAWIHFSLDKSGKLVGVESLYFPLSPEIVQKVKNSIADAKFTKEEILATVEEDRRREKPEAKIDAVPYVERLVFSSPPYLRWKVSVAFENDVRQWGYHVDAFTGDIIRRIPPLPEGPSNEAPPPPPPTAPPGPVYPVMVIVPLMVV